MYAVEKNDLCVHYSQFPLQNDKTRKKMESVPEVCNECNISRLLMKRVDPNLRILTNFILV